MATLEELENYEDLALALKTDPNNLELDCARQSGLCHYWGDELAEAKYKRDKKEDAIDLRKAKVELQIRNDPGAGKVTADHIKALVNADPDLVKNKADLCELSKRVYSLEAVTKALDHKKAQLDNLVQLWLRSYYSDAGKSATKDPAKKYTLRMNKPQGEAQ